MSATIAAGNTLVDVAVLLRAANPTREAIDVEPLDGDVYYGGAGVTTSTGLRVPVGSLLSERDFTGDVYVIAAAGAVNVRWREVG
jgi:hypothetical protein